VNKLQFCFLLASCLTASIHQQCDSSSNHKERNQPRFDAETHAKKTEETHANYKFKIKIYSKLIRSNVAI